MHPELEPPLLLPLPPPLLLLVPPLPLPLEPLLPLPPPLPPLLVLPPLPPLLLETLPLLLPLPLPLPLPPPFDPPPLPLLPPPSMPSPPPVELPPPPQATRAKHANNHATREIMNDAPLLPRPTPTRGTLPPCTVPHASTPSQRHDCKTSLPLESDPTARGLHWSETGGDT
jgi:hypothetical protein